MNPFEDKKGALIKEIKVWIRKVLTVSEGDIVLVSELKCAEAGCPDIETVISILGHSGSRKFKIAKSLREITISDIESLVTENSLNI